MRAFSILRFLQKEMGACECFGADKGNLGGKMQSYKQVGPSMCFVCVRARAYVRVRARVLACLRVCMHT
jgi:hypothetical protein